MDYKIAASILNADFLRLKEEIDDVADGIDEIHLDVMDGVFVENISFGPSVLAGIAGAYPGMPLEAHLMIIRPQDYWRRFKEIGCGIITFHYEATHHGYILLRDLRQAGVRAGVSITPGTPVSALTSIAEYIDRLLVMTVEPGFGGQKFIPEMLPKIERARKLVGDEVDIEVDGGIDEGTIGDAKSAGANVFVVGSYLFKAQDRRKNLEMLREKLA
ncbi:MAG: ribulose-phosphate 3-epimerase [Spirochaetaceae bacterium]